MNNEEFERRMEFILEQQAKFEENFAKQQEYNAQAIARLESVDRQIAELVGFSGVLRDALIGLTHNAERHDREIGDIRRAIAEQAEKGKETDVRLNALMLVVERHVSDHL
jgi:hypothetical protein